jgi:tetratricopeptide (TPR) repeat protein
VASIFGSSQAIALNPQSAIAYVSRGLLKYEKLNDVQGALADYNQAIALNLNNADAYAYRGLLKAQKANDVRVPPIDWNTPFSHKQYLNTPLTRNRNYDEAQAYRSLVRQQQLDASIYRSSMKSQKLNYVRDALADYTQAISLKPNYAAAYAYRGLLKYEHLNDVRGAILDMQQAVKLYQQQGKPQDAQNAIALIRQWQQ